MLLTWSMVSSLRDAGRSELLQNFGQMAVVISVRLTMLYTGLLPGTDFTEN
jgi:hypothetical protein